MRFRYFFLIFLLASEAFAETKILKVAAYELDPYITEKGEEPGYLFEILEEAFSNAGYSLDIQFYPRLRARSLVESGGRDILIPTYETTQKSPTLLYSDPLQGSQISYIKLKDAKTPLAPVMATALDENVLDIPTRTRLQADKVNTFPVEKISQLLDMLSQKRLDIAIADRYAAAQVIGTLRPHLLGKLTFVDPPLLEKDFHVAFKKNPAGEKLRKAFNSALADMQRTGRYQKILENYGYRAENSDPKTLKIISVNNPDTRILEELSSKFLQTHPGVKINWILLEENLLRRRTTTSLALNDGAFDIYTVGAFDAPLYASNGWLEPLKSIPKTYDEPDLLPMIRQTLSQKGVYYALPLYGETSLTFYRKDLFAKAGLKMPESPTYSEIVRFAEALHDPQHGLYGICVRGKAGWGANVAFLSTMLNTFGGAWFDETWQPQISSPPFREAMAFYVTLVKRFGPPDTFRNGYPETLKLFSDGHCAMWIDASVGASYASDPSSSRVSDKIGYAYAPTEKTVAGRQWNWNWALGVSSASRKKALAQEFVQWATSKEYINLVAKEKGWAFVPPGTRRSTYNSSYLAAAPFASFVYKVMQNYVPLRTVHPRLPYEGYVFVDIAEFSAVGTALANHMADVLKGRETLDQALHNAQQEVRNIMYHSGHYRAEASDPNKTNGRESDSPAKRSF